MDEGAASLRDRDMIARRRGGPFVHRYTVSVFSLSASRTCVSSPSARFLIHSSYSPHTSHIRRNAAAGRTPVTGLSDLVVVFGERDCKKDSRTISCADISSGDLRSNVFADFARIDFAQYHFGIRSSSPPFVESRSMRISFSEIGRLKIKLHVLSSVLSSFFLLLCSMNNKRTKIKFFLIFTHNLILLNWMILLCVANYGSVFFVPI